MTIQNLKCSVKKFNKSIRFPNQLSSNWSLILPGCRNHPLFASDPCQRHLWQSHIVNVINEWHIIGSLHPSSCNSDVLNVIGSHCNCILGMWRQSVCHSVSTNLLLFLSKYFRFQLFLCPKSQFFIGFLPPNFTPPTWCTWI